MPPSSKKSKGKSYRTDWDPLARWYDGWVGESGSKHHRLLAIPTLLDLVEIQPGETLLDVGCGQGAFSGYVIEAGGKYSGVDLSEEMIRIARTRFRDRGTFLVGDALDLGAIDQLDKPGYDIITFLLSLQDMDPLFDAVRSAAALLKKGGRMGILLTHPSFRIPRQSGWGWDDNRKLRFRRVDSYLSRLAVPLKLYPGKSKGVTRSFHRPLQDYVQALTGNNLVIDGLVEIPTYKEATAGDNPKSVNRANREIPLFLGLRARKPDI